MAEPTMSVVRVKDSTGRSYIEPELNPEWDALTKLRWHAAVVSHDTGLDVRVSDRSSSRWRRGRWEQIPGTYSIRCGSSSIASFDYNEAWVFLTGLEMGVDAARAEVAS